MIETAPFLEAVKRVSLVAERNTPVRLSLHQGEVTLEAGAGDEAQASEAMDAVLDGEDISIAFNPSFLLDGLQRDRLPVRAAVLHHLHQAGASSCGSPALDAERRTSSVT